MWYKSSKPASVLFSAGVMLFTLEAPEVYQLEWKVGTLMCGVGHTGVLMAEMKLPQ